MSPDEKFKAQLWALPLSERVAALLCSIRGTHPSPQSWAQGVIGVLVTLTEYLGSEDRMQVAARMRVAADGLEGGQPVHEERVLPLVH